MERTKNLRRIRLLVTAQTAHNLERLAQMGRCDPGRVVDKLVREKRIIMNDWKEAVGREY